MLAQLRNRSRPTPYDFRDAAVNPTACSTSGRTPADAAERPSPRCVVAEVERRSAERVGGAVPGERVVGGGDVSSARRGCGDYLTAYIEASDCGHALPWLLLVQG